MMRILQRKGLRLLTWSDRRLALTILYREGEGDRIEPLAARIRRNAEERCGKRNGPSSTIPEGKKARPCGGGCGKSVAPDAPPLVTLTVESKEVQKIRRYVRIAQAQSICLRCPLRRRWLFLIWCGRPWPWRAPWILWAMVRRRETPKWPGCGCLLEVKQRLQLTPKYHAKRCLAFVARFVIRRRFEVAKVESHCPYGYW